MPSHHHTTCKASSNTLKSDAPRMHHPASPHSQTEAAVAACEPSPRQGQCSAGCHFHHYCSCVCGGWSRNGPGSRHQSGWPGWKLTHLLRWLASSLSEAALAFQVRRVVESPARLDICGLPQSFSVVSFSFVVDVCGLRFCVLESGALAAWSL